MKRLALIAAVLAVGGLVVITLAGCRCCRPKGGACAMPAMKHCEQARHPHGYGTVDTVGLKALMDAKTEMVIVDARGAKWDDGQRIAGAVSLPSDSTPEAIEKALPSKDALVVAYCSNPKCMASKELAKKLVSMGYTRVLKDPEGIQGWVDAGYPVTKVEKAK